jgi:hypothetical protein
MAHSGQVGGGAALIHQHERDSRSLGFVAECAEQMRSTPLTQPQILDLITRGAAGHGLRSACSPVVETGEVGYTNASGRSRDLGGPGHGTVEQPCTSSVPFMTLQLVANREQEPLSRDSLQMYRASIVELDAGAGNEVLDRVRDYALIRAGLAHHASGQRDGDAADVLAA